MKIALILEAVFPENKGGLERWYFKLSRLFVAAGHQVDYLNNSLVDEFRDGVQYKKLTNWKWFYLPGGVRSISQSVRFTLALVKRMRTEKYDAIYISSVPILSIFAVPFIKIGSPKTVVVVEWLELWPLRYWVSYKGRFLGFIGWLVQFVAAQLGNIKTTFVPRIYQPLDRLTLPLVGSQTILLSGLCSAEIETQGPAKIVKTDILFIGRLVDEKQPMLALEIVEKFKQTGWKGQFWMIGTGPNERQIRDYILDHSLGETVKLIHNATDELVQEKMNSSFVLLHPSKREGYGLVVVEAAFRGLPTLLINYSDNCAVDLQVTPELVVSSGNLDQVTKKLEFAASNSERLSAEAKRWADIASKQSTMEISAREILELFRHAKDD